MVYFFTICFDICRVPLHKMQRKMISSNLRTCSVCGHIRDLPLGTMPSGMQRCMTCGVEGKWHATPQCEWYLDRNTKEFMCRVISGNQASPD